MTREEAIHELERMKTWSAELSDDEIEALVIALKALDQEPCDDCISRQAAHMAIDEWMNAREYFSTYATPLLKKRIDKLLPVTPQQSCEDIAKAFQLGLAFGFGEKHDEMDKIMEEVKKVITPQPEPCGDAISRKAACDAIRKYKSGVSDPSAYDKGFDEGIDTAIAEIGHNVSSVSPQQRTGRWELVRYDGLIGNWHCSECRTVIPHMPEETDNTPIYKWCPMCGAEMEV